MIARGLRSSFNKSLPNLRQPRYLLVRRSVTGVGNGEISDDFRAVRHSSHAKAASEGNPTSVSGRRFLLRGHNGG